MSSIWLRFKSELDLSQSRVEQEDRLGQRQAKDRLIVNFFSVPWEIEKLMLYGYWVCLDALLTMLTFFPLRFLRSSFNLLTNYFKRLINSKDDDNLRDSQR